MRRLFSLLGILMVAAAPQARADGDALIIYPAYGDSRQAMIEGRVIEAHDRHAEQAADGRWRNLRRNARMMKNDERKRVNVELRITDLQLTALTDSEGYFKAEITGPVPAPGWHKVQGKVRKTAAEGDLLIVPPANTVGVISDLDDTILISNVPDKKELLKNTFLKNSLQRKPVPGAADYIRAIAARNPQPEAAPVIYLSASPRQIQGNILQFLKHNDFPPGILLTKRVTNDKTSDPITDQIVYKTAKIEDILVRLPNVRFVLLGDDGEYDPEIYKKIAQKYPGRIERILIRHVHPEPRRAKYAGQLNLNEEYDKFVK